MTNDIVQIAIIGDYDGRPSHIATDEAIKHCAESLGIELKAQWFPTDELLEETECKLSCFDGLWCAPGSPYKSMLGALKAIQFARENKYPFIGTCGGFQHAAIEFARNVLKISSLLEDEFDPYSPNLFITALSCSLVGQTRNILLKKDTMVSEIYGATKTEERYNCNFGVNKEFQSKLELNGLRVTGTDEEGEARIVELDNHSFYVATLFQPQLSSTKDNPHPLIQAYLAAAREFHTHR